MESRAAQQRCRKLAPLFRDIYVVTDDESYFTFKNNGISGISGFYILNLDDTPPKIQFAQKEKFPTRIMVWIASKSAGYRNHFSVVGAKV